MGFKMFNLDKFKDDRGCLVALDKLDVDLFSPKRLYYIYDTPIGVYRGFHSHHLLKQIVICLSGSFEFKLHDGNEWYSYQLDEPNKALYIDKPAWREFTSTSDRSVLLVLASEYYDEDDYVYDFEDFIINCKSGGSLNESS